MIQALLWCWLAIYTKVTVTVPAGNYSTYAEIPFTTSVTSTRFRGTSGLVGEYTADPGTIDWVQIPSTVVCDGPTNCPPLARGTSAMPARIFALYGIEEKNNANFAF